MTNYITKKHISVPKPIKHVFLESIGVGDDGSDIVVERPLPDELMLMIFSNFTDEELVRMVGVCREARRIGEDNSLWLKLCENKYSETELQGLIERIQVDFRKELAGDLNLTSRLYKQAYYVQAFNLWLWRHPKSRVRNVWNTHFKHSGIHFPSTLSPYQKLVINLASTILVKDLDSDNHGKIRACHKGTTRFIQSSNGKYLIVLGHNLNSRMKEMAIYMYRKQYEEIELPDNLRNEDAFAHMTHAFFYLNRLIAIGGDKKLDMIYFDLEKGERITRMTVQEEYNFSDLPTIQDTCRALFDGHYLVVFHLGGYVKMNAETEDIERVISYVYSFDRMKEAWLKNGKLIYLGVDYVLLMVSINTGQEISRFQLSERASKWIPTNDSALIVDQAELFKGTTINVTNIETGRTIKSILAAKSLKNDLLWNYILGDKSVFNGLKDSTDFTISADNRLLVILKIPKIRLNRMPSLMIFDMKNINRRPNRIDLGKKYVSGSDPKIQITPDLKYIFLWNSAPHKPLNKKRFYVIEAYLPEEDIGAKPIPEKNVPKGKGKKKVND